MANGRVYRNTLSPVHNFTSIEIIPESKAVVRGISVMLYPDCTLYGQVQPEDVAETVEEHLEKGKVVGRLALMNLPA